MIVLLFTTSYPYDGAAEQTFLNREIEYLASSFDKVALIPQNSSGIRLHTPPNVEVLEDYAANLSKIRPWRIVLTALLQRIFYSELGRVGPSLLRLSKLQKLVSFIARAQFTAEWICSHMEENSLDPKECIIYTYWFDRASLGAGLAKKRKHICVVSRAHGADLYEERHQWSYIPCRRQALTLIDRLFPDSERGTRYLAERYPESSTKIETARLGVPDPGFLASRSNDGMLRIASCSFLVPLKRIDLLLMGIGEAARLRPHQSFEWNHFGTGPLLESLQDSAKKILPPNVEHNFRGYVSQAHLMQFYRDNPIDVFANVSETEGTSVAVMEAISCGIPVVATAVGGNPEIATEENGLLLDPNPSANAIASALLFFLDNPVDTDKKRKGSRELWEKRYNSELNFADFVTRVKAVRKTIR